MNRLTKRSDGYVERNCQYPENLVGEIPCFNCTDRTKCNDDIFLKLAEYEDLEEQGLLLRLPVAIGDEVWRISTKFQTKMRFVEKTTVNRVAIEKDRILIFCSCNPTGKTIFGKTVFLKKTEAEEKLRELEGKR